MHRIERGCHGCFLHKLHPDKLDQLYAPHSVKETLSKDSLFSRLGAKGASRKSFQGEGATDIIFVMGAFGGGKFDMTCSLWKKMVMPTPPYCWRDVKCFAWWAREGRGGGG